MKTYQEPELTLVGTARESILGIVSLGFDTDGQTFPDGSEFAEDPPED